LSRQPTPSSPRTRWPYVLGTRVFVGKARQRRLLREARGEIASVLDQRSSTRRAPPTSAAPAPGLPRIEDFYFFDGKFFTRVFGLDVFIIYLLDFFFV